MAHKYVSAKKKIEYNNQSIVLLRLDISFIGLDRHKKKLKNCVLMKHLVFNQ